MESVSRSSSSLEEGPEYRAMRECNAMMVNVLKSSIGNLSDELFGKGLIPLDVKENIRSIPSPADKTRKVLDCIIRKVEYNPKIFHNFMDVLKKEQNLQDVSDQLLSCYQSQTATPQPSSSLTPSHSQGGSQHYTLPSHVIKTIVESMRVILLSQNQSVIESPLRVKRDNTRPQPNTDTQITWDTDPRYVHGAIGTADILLLVSKVSGVNVVPRRNRPPLTEEEKHKVQEQGIHEDLCLSDLSIMKTRYDVDKRCSSAGVLTGEQRTCDEVRQIITKLFNTTDKGGVVLYYIGPGQRETGNWCFKDGFISFQEIMELYTRHLKPRGSVLLIVSDCSYSGHWVKEAMTFMDGQGVGPCGHQAKEKGILVKVFTSCLANEVPVELAFSTNILNTDDTGTPYYTCIIQLRGEKIHDDQHPSGLNFTQVRCNNKIDQPCTMAPQSTWQQWSDGPRIRLVFGKTEGRPVWFYIKLYDDDEMIRRFKARLRIGSLNISDYGRIIMSGWGEDPPEKTKIWIKNNYYMNYKYQPSQDTTD